MGLFWILHFGALSKKKVMGIMKKVIFFDSIQRINGQTLPEGFLEYHDG